MGRRTKVQGKARQTSGGCRGAPCARLRPTGAREARAYVQSSSWQLTDAQRAKVDRRALGLETEKTARGIGAVAAGDFLAVHPEPDLAVDRSDIVVVPLAVALGEILARETPAAVGRARLEVVQLHAHREDIAIGREPIGGALGVVLFEMINVVLSDIFEWLFSDVGPT